MSTNNKEKINFNKENPFRTPEGYFENLSGKIMQKIGEPEETVRKVSAWRVFKTQFAVAAGIIGFALLAYYSYHFISSNNSLLDKNNVIAVVAVDTTDAELSFVDESHIIEAISTTTPKQEVNGDDLINYLIEDDIDENLIAEAY